MFLLLFMRILTDANWFNAILVALIGGSIAAAAEASRRRRHQR